MFECERLLKLKSKSLKNNSPKNKVLPFKSGSVQHKVLPVPLAGYSKKLKTWLIIMGHNEL